jgi:hypothetical protein
MTSQSTLTRTVPSHYLGEEVFCSPLGGRQVQATAACKVDNHIYMFFATNDATTSFYVEKWNLSNNKYVSDETASSAQSPCGQAASACRKGSLFFLCPRHPIPQTGPDASTNKLDCYDEAFTQRGVVQLSFYPYACSCDPVSNKLYAMRCDEPYATVSVYEVTLSDLNPQLGSLESPSSVSAEASLVGSFSIADMTASCVAADGELKPWGMAVYDGVAYVSFPNRYILVYELGDTEYSSLHYADANSDNHKYFLGELRDLEFSSDGKLIAMNCAYLEPKGGAGHGGVNAVVTELPVCGAGRFFAYSNFSSVEAAATAHLHTAAGMAREFSLGMFYYRSLAQLQVALPKIATIDVPGAYTDPYKNQTLQIHESLMLVVEQNCSYTLENVKIDVNDDFGVYLKAGESSPPTPGGILNMISSTSGIDDVGHDTISLVTRNARLNIRVRQFAQWQRDGGYQHAIIIDSGYNPNLICIGLIDGTAWFKVNGVNHSSGLYADTPVLHMGAAVVYHS